MTGKNPNPDIDNMNAYKKFGQILSKFWDKSRAITLLQMCWKWYVTILT